MAQTQDLADRSKVRLKFKKIYSGRLEYSWSPCLLPKGYRLATIEEIRDNLEIIKKWGLPIKTFGPSHDDGECRGDWIRLLDGWLLADHGNYQLNEGPCVCQWYAVVKKKEWDTSAKKWRNCPASYPSSGSSLRKQLYDGIPQLTAQGVEAAWLYAYIYEDVELLYWLWHNYTLPIDLARFINSGFEICEDNRTQALIASSDEIPFKIPLRKMVVRLGSHGSRSRLEMENAREEVGIVLESAVKRSRYSYGATWGLAMVELLIQVYGSAFAETAAVIALADVKSVPMFTKFLSLLTLKNEILNIRPHFAEVLIEAAERGYSPLVEYMLQYTDDIAQITTDVCLRALRAAVSGGYIELVRLLLHLLTRSGGSGLPVEVDDKRNTLFHHALLHTQVFQLLKQTYGGFYARVIPRQQNMFGRNILHCAAKGDCNSEVVCHIMESIPASSQRLIICRERDDRGRTPLHIAASKGDSGMIEKLVDCFQDARCRKWIHATDSSGRTALLMAAGEGHQDSVHVLLSKGSDPLKERDGQKRTALHHAAQVKDPNAALATCKALVEDGCLSAPKRSLLLWASATGIGTADEMEDVHPHVMMYLRSKKEEYRQHLLRAAALSGDAGMAWEIFNRGAHMTDILDPDWLKGLISSERESVENGTNGAGTTVLTIVNNCAYTVWPGTLSGNGGTALGKGGFALPTGKSMAFTISSVINEMERMKEQVRDQPSMEDKLGRHVFAEGVAALLLNRFIESPITVGVCGERGTGKSSLLLQSEKILLVTSTQLTFPDLLHQEQFDGARKISFSKRGRKIYEQIKRGVQKLLALSKDKSQKENPLFNILKKYQPQYYDVYKSLACMDSSQMLEPNSASQQEHALRGIPRVLTIRHHACHYRDLQEAWAGLGVTVAREIEKAMTRAQWMSTCWRFTWAKYSLTIWMQLFLPCLLIISVAGWVVWIVWMLLKQSKFQGLKYGSIPSTVIAIVWIVLKSVISVVKPVSRQMLEYITSSSLDHIITPLGYQQNVVSDINFLKKELGRKPHWFFSFILGVWCWDWFGLYADNIENTSIPKFMPACEDQIRIVIFLDELDVCDENAILQLLSAMNLISAKCKINVIMGINKITIEKAIRRNFEDVDYEDLAEKFICQTVQIRLNLPEPTEQETNSFLQHYLRHKIPTKYRENKKTSKRQHRVLVTVQPRIDTDSGKSATKQHNTISNIKLLKQGYGGIIGKAFDWLDCLSEFARNMSTEVIQPYDETFDSLRLIGSVKLIEEILLPNYTEEEAYIFYELSKFASGHQKLPGEWERLLSYHKFARYVLLRIGDVHSLPTWKEELIVWIFVCWQWKHEINHLIKAWQKYTSELISKKNKESNQAHCRGTLLSDIVAECMLQIKNSQSPAGEGSNTTGKQVDLMKRRSLKQDPSLEAILCLHRDNERIIKEGTSRNNWSKLEEVLTITDVSVEAIQLFQQFRLHCETDHLPWL